MLSSTSDKRLNHRCKDQHIVHPSTHETLIQIHIRLLRILQRILGMAKNDWWVAPTSDEVREGVDESRALLYCFVHGQHGVITSTADSVRSYHLYDAIIPRT